MFVTVFVTSTLAVDTVQSIEGLLRQSKHQEAYAAASSLISSDGLLDADPKLFYLRGQASNRIGKYEESIKDMTRFMTSGRAEPREKKVAYVTRGWDYLRLGNLEDATADATTGGDSSLLKSVQEARQLLRAAEANEEEQNWKMAFDKYQKLLRLTTTAPKFMGRAARVALSMGNRTVFADLSQRAVALAPRDPELLEMRGRYYLSTTDYTMAQKHLKLCVSVASNPGKCTALLKGMNTFQQQSKLATEAIAKKDFSQAQTHIDECQRVVSVVGDDESKLALSVQALRVKVLIAQGKKDEAVKVLDSLVKGSPNNDDLLIQRGEILLELGDYDGALADFQVVRNRSKNNQKVLSLIKKASDLQEKEKNVDYYTLLGVQKTASEKELKDAYRKAVVKWHPDRHREPLKKKEAEKKMKMINKGFDVLSDPQKRKLYDMGQDPENPMAGNPGASEQSFRSGPGQQTFHFGQGGGQQSFTFSRFPGGGEGGFDMFNLMKQMMGGQAGNFQFTTSSSRTTRSANKQQRNPRGNRRM